MPTWVEPPLAERGKKAVGGRVNLACGGFEAFPELHRAEAEGFELLFAPDQSLRHQQNLAGRRLSVLVLMSTSWPRIEARADRIAAAIERVAPGECVEVPV